MDFFLNLRLAYSLLGVRRALHLRAGRESDAPNLIHPSSQSRVDLWAAIRTDSSGRFAIREYPVTASDKCKRMGSCFGHMMVG